MKTVLVLGSGRSAGALISYLLEKGSEEGWQVVVGDLSLQAAADRVGRSPVGKAIYFDTHDEEGARQAIRASEVVISMLPSHMHIFIARICLELGRHLLTASYVSDELQAMQEEVQAKGLLFLNECGLDPGIDHMSAMKMIDDIKARGGELLSFESYTGGLIAPETDPDNPWRYKFTWNPRNVVMAGQAGAVYQEKGQLKHIPYQQLFTNTTPVHVSGYGDFDGYANRDSVKYVDTYGLHGIDTMIRGTLRYKGFCQAWNVFVQLGCCDDTQPVPHAVNMTHRAFIDSFLPAHASLSTEEKLMRRFTLAPAAEELQCLRWSGMFTEEPVGLEQGTPAQLLEHILNKKWKLHAGDKDMIVMWHRIGYRQVKAIKKIEASLVVQGEDAQDTAMAKTVGLPLGIAARLLLREKITLRGVVIPINEQLYQPILHELLTYGIEFNERME